MSLQIIPPRSGAAFELARGQTLTVIDPEGEQVSEATTIPKYDFEFS